MVNNRVPSVFSKTYVTPRRPFEKARLDQELKIIGEYGLRNKREVWRVKYTLARIRKAARELLTLEEKDPKRLFEGTKLYLVLNLVLLQCKHNLSILRHMHDEVTCNNSCILIIQLGYLNISRCYPKTYCHRACSSNILNDDYIATSCQTKILVKILFLKLLNNRNYILV